MTLRERLKVGAIGVLAAVLVFVIYNLVCYVLAGEEGRIRKFILNGKRVVEKKDIFTCAKMVSGKYQDKYGNDYASLIYFTKEFFGYYKNFIVHIEKIEINLEKDKQKAAVKIQATVLGEHRDSRQENILEGERGEFQIKLIKEDGRWQLLELEFFKPLRIMGQNVS